MKAIGYALPFIAVLSLSACSAMFETGDKPTECPNQNDSGLPCTTTKEILEYADKPGGIAAEKARRAQKNKNESKPSKSASTESSDNVGYGGSLNLSEVRDAYMFSADLNRALPAPEPIAVRQAPRMLRVAFAPWQDDKGRLQNIGYVFAEIETRKFVYGREVFNMPAQITPLHIRQQSIEDERKGNPSSINGVGISTPSKASVEAVKAVIDSAPAAAKNALNNTR